MKKYYLLLAMLLLTLMLVACGSSEDGADTDSQGTGTEQEKDINKEDSTAQKNEDTQVASTVDPRLKEIPEGTICEVCNMEVYTKDHELGVFSAQAIKEDGTNAFYDDIGCLLNAEIQFNETNEKFVRDFNTLEWLPVEEAVIVKTKLKSPMNWGYIFFKDQTGADQYMTENADTHIEKLETIVQAAKERMEQKMKQKSSDDMDSQDHSHSEGESHSDEESHNHSEGEEMHSH